MSQWFDISIKRLMEYGMHASMFPAYGLKKEDYQKTEDELTHYFVEEMSKRPKYIPEEL